MVSKARFIVIAALGSALAAPATALELGQPAPPLQVAEWVRGDPVKLPVAKTGQKRPKSGEGEKRDTPKPGLGAKKLEKGENLYVLQFWATWCGPCRESIPRLTELEKKLKAKGVRVVGIADEAPGKVKPFVKQQGKRMGYTVAIDKEGAMGKAYMGGFGINTIPHVFVVGSQGRVLWHGSPGAALEKTVKQILAGKYDLEAAQRAEEARKLVPEYLMLVIAPPDSDRGKPSPAEKAKTLGAKIVKDGAADASFMSDFSWSILVHPRIPDGRRDLSLALEAGKAAYDASEGMDPDVLETYARALFDNGKRREAIKLQKKAVGLCKDARMLRALKEGLQRYEKAVARDA